MTTWTAYKNKTEEILVSISNLLGEISDDTQRKTVLLAKQNKPETIKFSCSICFDEFV